MAGPSIRDLYRQMGLSDSQVSSKGTVTKDKWKTDLLTPLSKKKYGSTNDKKLQSIFGNEWTAKDFERWMDYRSANQTIDNYKSQEAANKWEKARQKSTGSDIAYINPDPTKNTNEDVARLQQFNQDMAPKLQIKKQSIKKDLVPKPKKKDEPFLTDVKNFFTGKDTNGDGQRDGLYGFLDRYVLPISQAADEVLLPGNEAQQRKNELEKYGKIVNPATKAGMVDRGTETKILHGLGTTLGYVAPMGESYKAVDYGLTKLPKVAQLLSKPVVNRAAKGAVASGLGETALAAENELVNPDAANLKDYATRIGIGTAAGAVLDPALYLAGAGIRKGTEKYAESTMKNLLPNQEEVQKALTDTVKSAKGDFALPVGKGKNPAEMQNILQNVLKNSNNAPPLTNPMDNLIPKIGQSTGELKPISEPDIPVNAVEPPKTRAEQLRTKAAQLEQQAEQLRSKNEMDTQNIVPGQPVQKGQNYSEALRGREEKRQTLLQQADELRKQADASENYQVKQQKRAGMSDVEKKIEKTQNDLNKAKSQLEAAKSGNSPSLESFIPQLEKDVPKLEKRLAKLQQQHQETLKQATQQAEMPVNTNIPKQQVNPQQAPLQRPENLPYVEGERKLYSTITNSEKATNEFIDRVKNLDRKKGTVSDKEAVDFANAMINKNMDEAYSYVKNAEIRDKRHNAVGLRLIDELQKRGDYNRAIDMIDLLAKEGTKHGRGLQSFTLYNRLTPEGQLIRAQRLVNKINERAGVNAPKVELTEDMQKTIVHTADSIQKLTGQAELGKNVIDVVEKMKKGEMATDEETQMIKRFFEDAKKYISDLDPKAKPPKANKVDVRTRDKVVDFMSKQEELSKQELKKIFRRANSMPVDALYHLSIIGASKIAKGTVKFADFSEQMVKEVGEDIKPFMQQIYNKAVETFNLQSSKMTTKRLTTAEKVVNRALKDKTLDDVTAKEINRLLRQVVDATEDSKFEANMELQMVLNSLEKPTFGQKVSSFQTMMQLFNPLTMERNIIGNEAFYRTERASKILLAAPFDKARVAIFGGKRQIVLNSGQFSSFKDFFQPSIDYWKGLKMGAKAGWNGVNPYGLQTAYDIRPMTFKFKPLQYMERALGAGLRGFDTASYLRAYKAELRNLGTLRAMEEGLKGKALREAATRYSLQVDENLAKLAEDYGKYATFQDETGLSKALQQIKKWLNFNKEFGFGDLILKYPKTPANIIMRAIDYSPAGFIRSASYLRQFYKFRNPSNIADFEMSFARAIMGTAGFSAFGWVLADKGVLTTKGSSDPEVNALERQAGKQPNSVNWSAIKRFITSFDSKQLEVQKGDTFVSYDWMQPIAISLAIGGGINQSMKEKGKLNAFQAAKTATSSAVDTVLNMSVLSGLKNFLQTTPGEDNTDRFAKAAEGLGSSFIPTGLNQVRKLMDNTTRDTYAPNFTDSFLNKSMNRIPGLEKKLPASYDTLGNKKENYQNSSNNIGNVFFNPSYVSKYEPSPEAQYLLDYINQTGDLRAAPRVPFKTLDGVQLTAQQREEWQKVMGQETQKGLKELIPKLKGENNQEAIGKKIYDLLNAAGKKGRSAVRNQLVTRSQLDEANKKYGLSADTIYERLSKGWTLNRALTTP